MPAPPAAPPAVRALRTPADADTAADAATAVTRPARRGARRRPAAGRVGRRLVAGAVLAGGLLALAVPAVRAAALPGTVPAAAPGPVFPTGCIPDRGGPGGCVPGPTPPLIPPTGLPVPPAPSTPPPIGPSAPPTALPPPVTPAPTATQPPTTPAPTTGPPVTVDPPVDQPGGVTGWIARGISSAISSFFRGLVTAALNPLLRLLGRTLLSTPTPGQLPHVGELWESGRQFTVAAYVLLVIIAGITVMAHETVQTRYSIKELAPRVVVGFLAANLSLLLTGQAIAFANAASQAALGDGVNPDSAAGTLSGLVVAALRPNNGLFLVFLGLALAGMLVALLVGYVVRVALTVSLIAGAAPALACFATPWTEGVARWWCRAFAGVLAIQIGQSIALAAAVRVFFSGGGWNAFGPGSDGLVTLLVTLALIYILFKIPFWVLQAVQVGGGRRSFLGTLVRGFLAYKTLGLLGGHGGQRSRSAGGGRRGGPGGPGGPGAGGRRGPRPRPGGGAGGGGGAAADPYERVRTDATGQTLLPLAGLRRVPRPAAPARPGSRQPSARPRRPAAGRQLRLPLDGTWPEDRPVLQRDGQYRLPIPVTRVRRPTPPAPADAGPRRPAAGRGRQLEIPFDTYARLRPERSGQYRLPLDGITRVPRPTPPTPPPPAARRGAARGQQLRLPLDLPARTTRPRPPTPAVPRQQPRPTRGSDPR